MKSARSYCSRRVVAAISAISFLILLALITSRKLADGTSRLLRKYASERILSDGELMKTTLPNYITLSDKAFLNDDIRNISVKMDQCFKASHLRLFDGLSEKSAMKSAESYVREFRNVIPMTFQSANLDHPSHCWKMSYEVHSSKYDARHIWGHVGNVTFDEVIPDDYRSSLLKDVQNDFKNHFTSQTVCLPNLFLLGFPKCGSTFLWCLIERIVNVTIKVRLASFKEPGWWYERNDYTMKKMDAAELGRYIANFVTPIRAMEKSRQMNIILADGTPGIAYATPRFNRKEHQQLNYCLLPTVIPHFLPHAKFIMIMREPADALYSLFWWACKGRLNNRTQRAVPAAFHRGVVMKIDTFNKCMRNEKIQNISKACSVSDPNYGSCITHPKRLAMLDKCVDRMTTIQFSTQKSGMPNCAKFGFNMYLYFIHVRRWLSTTPRENFYFLTLNDTSDPVTVARRVFKLMNIPLPMDFDLLAKQAYSECQWRKNKQKVSYSQSATLQMREETRLYLQKFFAPFNEMLSGLLHNPKFLFTVS